MLLSLWVQGPLVISYEAQVLTYLLYKISDCDQNHGNNEQWVVPYSFRRPI